MVCTAQPPPHKHSSLYHQFVSLHPLFSASVKKESLRVSPKTDEELQHELQRELEHELERQHATHAAQAKPQVKQEIHIGGDSTTGSWGQQKAEKRPYLSPKLEEAPVKMQPKLEGHSDAEFGKRRVDVDDPATPQEEVIAQLKADLTEALARKKAEDSVMVRLARKEVQILELKVCSYVQGECLRPSHVGGGASGPGS